MYVKRNTQFSRTYIRENCVFLYELQIKLRLLQQRIQSGFGFSGSARRS